MNERQIFEGALEFADPAERRAYVERACGDNAGLRAGVEALLASHEAKSRFLDQPAMEQLRAPAGGLDRTTDHASGGLDDDESDGPQPPDLSFLLPSTKPGSLGRLGHYEILQVLGQGAFGIVFRAFDEKLHRQVAVKAMNPQLAATSPPRKRFLREARSVAATKHENIVQVYSVEEQPLPYLVMELVQGQTLQQKLDGAGPLEVSEFLHLARQMAAGLAAAHAQGLIHRDIKPGNILLEQGAEQKVKITDFGLARAADEASMTRTGMISGTPLYMAPEQALGQALDGRSDLFSLGSVLYQMACGRAAFRAPSTMAVLRRVVDETPRDMTEVIPELPRWLTTIVMKLLAKQPADRYQSAKEVADLLARCQNELQLTGKVTCVPAQPATPPAEAKPPAARAAAQLLAPSPDSHATDSPSAASPWGLSPNYRPLLGATLLFGVLALIVGWFVFRLRQADEPLSPPPAPPPPVAAAGWHGRPADAPAPAITPFDAAQAKKHQKAWADYLKVPVEHTNSIGMKFVLIPPGEFLMGSTEEEVVRMKEDSQASRTDFDESPQHRVILTQPFYYGIHEVTRGDYRAVTGRANEGGANQCVNNVSWLDAAAFCTKLGVKEGLPVAYELLAGEGVTITHEGGYRLPTEAQWEYACRAGTTTRYWTGDDDAGVLSAGWFEPNSGRHVHDVGTARANPFGIFDVHGNVHEFCQDNWNPEYYAQFRGQPAIDPLGPPGPLRPIIRGAGSSDPPLHGRATERQGFSYSEQSANVGFRVTLPVGVVRAVLKLAGPAIPRSPSADAELPSAEPIDYAAERKAAEYLASVLTAGYVQLTTKILTSEDKTLPEGNFAITQIRLEKSTVDDAGMAHLQDCRQLTRFVLHENKSVSSRGLKHLTQSRHLEFLVIGGIKDDPIPLLANWPSLRELELSGPGLTPIAISKFPPLSQLEILRFDHNALSAANWATLAKQCPNLKNIGQANVVGEVAHNLTDLKSFRRLEFFGGNGAHLTEVNAKVWRELPKLESLQFTTPNIDGPGSVATLVPLADKLHRLYFYPYQGPGLGDADYEAIAKLHRLNELRTGWRGSPTDAQLMLLANLPDLQVMEIGCDEKDRRYTPAGIAAFRKARPDVRLTVDGKVYVPYGPDVVDYAAQRKLAEWVIGRGGEVDLVYPKAGQVGPVQTDVSRLDLIRAGDVVVVHLQLIDDPSVKDDELRDHLALAPHLTSLQLHGLTQITISALEPLRGSNCLRRLRVKYMTGMKSDISTFAYSLPMLRQIELMHAGVDDETLIKIASKPGLRQIIFNRGLRCPLGVLLALQKRPVEELDTDFLRAPEVEAVGKIPSLKRLSCALGELQGGGLESWTALRDLEFLSLLSPAPVEGPSLHALMPKLPRLKVLHLLENAATDDFVVAAAKSPSLRELQLQLHHELTDASFLSLTKLKTLESIFVISHPSLPNVASPSDAILLAWTKISRLKHLYLSFGPGRKYTPAGLDAFRRARPDVRLDIDGKIYEPYSPIAASGWQGWPADVPAPAVAPFDAAQAKKHQSAWAAYLKVPVEYENSLKMKFVLIPPGEFLMGSTAAEIEAALQGVGPRKDIQANVQSEGPQHKVILTQPIYLGAREVTQGEYEKVMGVNPSHFAPQGTGKDAVAGMETTDHPVEMVSWNDAAEFCAKLSEREKLKPFYARAEETITPLDGVGYRLPSEAEWEVACRAGTTTKYWSGEKEEDLALAGWFFVNSGWRTHAVGELKANPFGLFDTHGNVMEWVQDGWDAAPYSPFREKPAINPHVAFSDNSRRVIRGGRAGNPAIFCRSSTRHLDRPTTRVLNFGFRVALPVEAAQAPNPER